MRRNRGRHGGKNLPRIDIDQSARLDEEHSQACWGEEPHPGEAKRPAVLWADSRGAMDPPWRHPSRQGPQRLVSSAQGGDSRVEKQELRALSFKRGSLC